MTNKSIRNKIKALQMLSRRILDKLEEDFEKMKYLQEDDEKK